MESDRAALLRCLFFQGKTPEELDRLLGGIQTRIRTYRKDEILVTEGDPALDLGIVLTGEVEVQKIHPAGNTVTLARLGPGQTFGEAVLFSRGKVYPATVQASAVSRVMLIAKPELLRLFAADTDILSRYMENMSERLVMLNRKIEILSLGTLRRRIAFYLLRESSVRHSDRVTIPFSKRVWADHLNTTRPSLSREIGCMREQRWIDFAGNDFHILDRKALEQLLG